MYIKQGEAQIDLINLSGLERREEGCGVDGAGEYTFTRFMYGGDENGGQGCVEIRKYNSGETKTIVKDISKSTARRLRKQGFEYVPEAKPPLPEAFKIKNRIDFLKVRDFLKLVPLDYEEGKLFCGKKNVGAFVSIQCEGGKIEVQQYGKHFQVIGRIGPNAELRLLWEVIKAKFSHSRLK